MKREIAKNDDIETRNVSTTEKKRGIQIWSIYKLSIQYFKKKYKRCTQGHTKHHSQRSKCLIK
jgi:hypothetical protein